MVSGKGEAQARVDRHQSSIINSSGYTSEVKRRAVLNKGSAAESTRGFRCCDYFGGGDGIGARRGDETTV